MEIISRAYPVFTIYIHTKNHVLIIFKLDSNFQSKILLFSRHQFAFLISKKKKRKFHLKSTFIQTTPPYSSLPPIKEKVSFPNFENAKTKLNKFTEIFTTKRGGWGRNIFTEETRDKNNRSKWIRAVDPRLPRRPVMGQGP